ncbi:hypothetical protein SPI_04471 [Niveomyces insectorum RCEF 264]|uniref:DUF8035 domain-containing protein n=1 Tax=Niveomyces insectorum RCEF 264 TaxID=1081102 RepID=A0A167UIL6_9HYPO|nr:hypothetical protein SPI_04471 [Niveomyces insectorum RCEF 264]
MASRRSRDSIVDERDYVDVRVREREPSRTRDPLARYFQEERRSNADQLVLRQRDVEDYERPRARPRSVAPMPQPRAEREVDRVEFRDRIVERERDRGPERLVTRVVERERERERSPTPSPEREDRIRIVERRSRVSSPSPSPSPPPPEPRPVIRGPVVEREVITHYTDIDHGVVYERKPTPQPAPRERERDTEIDVYSSRHRTEVDISESTSRERHRSRSRSRSRMHVPPPARASDREVIVRSDRNRLEVDIDEHGRRRRAHSAAPPRIERRYDALADEAAYIEARIDERGRIGEAYNGATRDWTIVDVPPGTERVRMDGVGGGSADVTWQRYNGVRRTRFIPERDGELVVAAPREKPRERTRERERGGGREHINVQVIDENHGRERRVVDVDRRMVVRDQPSRELVPALRDDMWTEITKDLVVREAIEQYGYRFTETDDFFYVLQYLHYDDVHDLVELSNRIRRRHRERPRRAIRGSREELDIDIDIGHHRHRSSSHHRPQRRDERVYQQEVIVDHLHPSRAYYR